jgi:hypothetical protein
MCHKCLKIDADIVRYHRFIITGLDALTIERIDGLIQELEQRKAAMHDTSDVATSEMKQR